MGIPKRDLVSRPQMIIVRSFQTNKPGTRASDITGAVLGGSILKGILKIGQKIETLKSEQNCLSFALPGGLIAVGTTLDPCLACERDSYNLIGNILGEENRLPQVFDELEITFKLLKKFIGSQTQNKEKILREREELFVNIGSMKTKAIVKNTKNDLARLQLDMPVCTTEGEKVVLSREVHGHTRMIGWGSIQTGIQCLCNHR